MTVKSKTTLNKLTYLYIEKQNDELNAILDTISQILVKNGFASNVLQL